MTQRLAILSVHTSPIAAPGGKKVGGMNTYVREIAQEFAQRGVLVDIFTRRTNPTQTDTSLTPGVQVIHVKAGPPVPLAPADIYPHLQQFTAGVIAHTIRTQHQYDLIFSHYWLSGWVAHKLKEACGTPFVQMFHTLGHMKNRIPSVTVPVPDVRIRTETAIVAWADALIANTHAERDQLLWLYHADRRKIAICPPGVNIQRFQSIQRDDARRHLNIPPGQHMLTFAGRIEPLKAVDTILHALAILRNTHPELVRNIRLNIIGGDPTDPTDPDMQSLLRLRDHLHLNPQIAFFRAMPQDTLRYYYAASDAVLMPSEYESFGMVALEAMATGTPVIASEVGGLAYLVQDGQTGYLIPARSPDLLADRIATLITHPALRDQMSIRAAALATEYAWPTITDRLQTIFAQLNRTPSRYSSSSTGITPNVHEL